MTTRKTSATVGQAWTPAEQAALIAAYNAMHRADTAGQKYSKAAINRYLRGDFGPADKSFSKDSDNTAGCSPDLLLYQGILAARSRGSVEAKLMNISGAREVLRLPILAGYKPAPNFQQSLIALVQQAEVTA